MQNHLENVLILLQRSDESEESEDTLKKRKEESKNGRDKGGRENGNVNGQTTEQPSKKRKEDFSEAKLDVKKPSSEKKNVCKLFDDHTRLKVENLTIFIN